MFIDCEIEFCNTDIPKSFFTTSNKEKIYFSWSISTFIIKILFRSCLFLETSSPINQVQIYFLQKKDKYSKTRYISTNMYTYPQICTYSKVLNKRPHPLPPCYYFCKNFPSFLHSQLYCKSSFVINLGLI